MTVEEIIDHPTVRAIVEQRAREIAARRLDAAHRDLQDAEHEAESLGRQITRLTAERDQLRELLTAELRAPVELAPPSNVRAFPRRPRTGLLVFPDGGAA